MILLDVNLLTMGVSSKDLLFIGVRTKFDAKTGSSGRLTSRDALQRSRSRIRFMSIFVRVNVLLKFHKLY